MKRLLWVGDAAVGSGFGKATGHILRHVAEEHRVYVIGVNYRGDPHDENYHIWPAILGGDVLGVSMLKRQFARVRPDVIVLQANPWNIPHYMRVLRDGNYTGSVVGIIAVEGANCVGADLKGLDKAIFWTEFGKREARGWEGASAIVPLGVDLNYYTPGDRVEARKKLGLPESSYEAFILGNVNRNQTRKRLDLTIQYFAEWYHRNGKPNAYVYMHCLPGSSANVNLEQLAQYYGVGDRLIYPEFKDLWSSVAEEWVLETMRSFDVQINSGLGEGWGLTTMEGMACGIPQIATDHSAIPEWAGDAVRLIPVCSVGVMPDVHTMIGGVPDKEASIAAIDEFYRDPEYRRLMGEMGRARVSHPSFRWENIAARFADEIMETVC